MSRRQAFTFFEVAISLALVAMAILTLAAFLPGAVRAHQNARFRLYADVLVSSLIDDFTGRQTTNSQWAEAEQCWDVATGYRSLAPDLEAKWSTQAGGMAPIPRNIAYRLDSDRDEIRRLLEDGGDLYYEVPFKSLVGVRNQAIVDEVPPGEARRLVVGVIGYSQQNAMPTLPWKAWPYRTFYPSGPMGRQSLGIVKGSSGAPNLDTGATELVNTVWERFEDPDVQYVWQHDFANFNPYQAIPAAGIDFDGHPSNDPAWTAGSSANAPAWHDPSMSIGPFSFDCGGYGISSGCWPYSGNVGNEKGWTNEHKWGNPTAHLTRWGWQAPGGGVPGWLSTKTYLALAIWYAQRKGLPDALLFGQATQADIEACWSDPGKVRALRFLAHAGMCMTKHYSLEAQAAQGATNVTNPIWGDTSVYPPWPAPAYAVNVTIPLSPRPAHPGLRLGIPIPGDDRANPADPVSINEQSQVPGRMNVPAAPAASLSWLFDLNTVRPLPPVAAVRLAPMRSDHTYQAEAARWAGQFFVTHDMIVNWHETCLKLVMRNVAENPYDWGVYRPANRPLMTDHPLLQWDVIDSLPLPRLSGFISGTQGDPNIPSIPAADQWPGGGIKATQWRPIAGRSITNLGFNGAGDQTWWKSGKLHQTTYQPMIPTWSSIEGDPTHFNLTKRFTAAERCRQIAVWAVDWQNYEDVESAAAAPVDASRYPLSRAGVGTAGGARDDFSYHAWSPAAYGNAQPGNFTAVRMSPLAYTSADKTFPGQGSWWAQESPSFRNPEGKSVFLKAMDQVATGDQIWPWTVQSDKRGNQDTSFRYSGFYLATGSWWPQHMPDEGFTSTITNFAVIPTNRGSDPRATIPHDPKAVFSGIHGADRNGNGVLDRGPIPAGTRLRAIEIARYNYYDPRLVMSLR